ncbi:helix-turn-helix domain-containing protein [Streptomyces zagrosensis]|uniref:Transcriptional regulator with XRE-family HTH domain n=1 Tax=Streptomyces zagrosensis TaxID=1042984 RepID=A0A7W9Q492_9ACTN|nr:helix-turn-helix transcriptional regulator [Streptomyces zagrosensis]MBB5933320.1 transcriptional regulator with XRE-family HTH domain [Streptomyces zagrosensis]
MIDHTGMTTGERIAYYRTKAGRTQAAVAGLVDRSEDWLSKVERGVLPLDSLSMLIRIARELGLNNVGDLVGPSLNLSLVGPEHPAVPGIRRALNAPPSLLGVGLPGDPLTAQQLAERVAEAWGIYETQVERYEPVGEMLPGLLAEAYTTLRATRGGEELTAVHALVSLLHLHQVFLRRLGERKLSLRAADRAMQIADETGDLALTAAAAWNVCGILTSSGEVADSLELARSTIAHCRPGDDPSPEHLSAYGALHLAAVIAAVRDNKAPTAWDMLRSADVVAERIGVDRNDFHTSFGPTNVRMHGVHLAAEEGDVSEALRLADDVEVPEPGGVLPLERTTRYRVEVMHAHRLSGDDFGALWMLRQIIETSPEEARYSSLVKGAVQNLLQRPRPDTRAELHRIAQHVGVWA